MKINYLKQLITVFALSSIPFSQTIFAQGVGVNDDNSSPDASAILDVKSSDKGMLVPRMTTAQRTTIASPATGLLVFDNTSGSFWFYSGSAWTELLSGTDSDNQDLSLSGNSLSLTNDASPVDLTPYMDNTDAQDLSLSGNTLSLTNDGTTVDLSSFLDADNLGNHVATQDLTMGAYNVSNVSFVDITAGNGNGLRFWQSDSYALNMGNLGEFQYGAVTGYSIKSNMNNDPTRGWTWGVDGLTPVASINTQGNMRIAANMTIDGLAGVGSRVVVANAAGLLSTQTSAALLQDKMVLSASFALSEDDVVATLGSTFAGDDVQQNIALPFSVTLDGTAYNNVQISTNGWIEFNTGSVSSTSSDLANRSLPATGHNNPFVAAYWDDLVANSIYHGVQGTAPNRVYIISYEARTFTGSYDVDFQIQIHEGSSLINVKYFNLAPAACGQSATIGYQGTGAGSSTAYPIGYNARIFDDNTDDSDPGSDSWSISPVR